MPVMIRKMTNDEFEHFYAWSAEHQAKDLTEELGIFQEEAIKKQYKKLPSCFPTVFIRTITI